MKNYLLIGLFGLLLTAGSEVESKPVEGTTYEVSCTKNESESVTARHSPSRLFGKAVFCIEANEIATGSYLTLAMTVNEEMKVKVPIYSVPLPNENKIVLVKDPKGFVERAIRHKMEFLAIKPSDKGEFWELMPVFANEAGGLSFSLNKSEDPENGESEEEPLRIVPVKDFIRYN